MSENERGFDYIAEAAVTCSPGFHGEKVASALLMAVLSRVSESLRDLDAIKKALFYGRDLPQHLLQLFPGHFVSMQNTPQLIAESDAIKPQDVIDVLHSVIGTATEAGEQIEMIGRWIAGAPLDKRNLFEEIGDTQWYAAIGLRFLGKTFDDVQRANIAKLRKRFPDKFTEYDANNRNVMAELDAMEFTPGGTVRGDGEEVR